MDHHSVSDYMAHGFCFLWNPGLVRLHVVSDIATGTAYYAIATAIFYFVYKRRDLPFLGMFVLFGIFILSCGTTHFLAAYTVYSPLYWHEGVVKAITALLSIGAAVFLIPLMPKAIALPSLTKALDEMRTSEESTRNALKRVEEEKARSERQLMRLAALRDIDVAITSSLDLRVTLMVILDEVIDQLSVDAADILLLNPRTHVLEYAESRGFRTTALRQTHLRLGEGHAGCAALERRTVQVSNLSSREDSLTRSPLLAGEGFAEYIAVPLISKGHVKGVLEIFHRSSISPDREWMDFLESLATQAAIAVDNAEMFNELERSNIELKRAYDTTLEGWSRALDYRDKETEGHSRRVTDLTAQIALAMGMSDEELVHVRRGALLHDIGKLGVPDSILLKPGKLTAEEWEVMKKHPIISYEVLSPISFLRQAVDIPYCHHEKWDGSGYPRGLKGEQIPLAARIFAIVDVWDALQSDRPYRPAWSREATMEYIRQQTGIQFDPKVSEVFAMVIESME